MSRDTYLQLISAWRLPTEFLWMLLSTMAIATTFSVPSGVAELPAEGNNMSLTVLDFANHGFRHIDPKWTITKLELLHGDTT
jgi:hypothetical protein